MLSDKEEVMNLFIFLWILGWAVFTKNALAYQSAVQQKKKDVLRGIILGAVLAFLSIPMYYCWGQH